MAHVLQLAHVAWEVKGRQALQRRLADALGVHPQLLGAARQEEAGQHGDVLAALAQRRQAQADHVQAVKEVFAEDAVAHPLFQVLVGGRDDTHIGLERLVPAHPVELPV